MKIPFTFKVWSQLKPSVRKEISPNIGLRGWDDISTKEEIDKIIRYFNARQYFWIFKTDRTPYSETISEIEKPVFYALNTLNSLYKKENFAPNLLESQAKEYSRHSVVKAAKDDFLKILRDGREAIVLELLSFYAEYLFGIKKDENLKRKEGEPEALYIKRNIDWKLKELDEFREVLNNIFEQFELNIHLTRAGFVYRNSKAIAERVYEPVLDFLMGEKWREVQRDMKDAFDDFRKGEHSDCITHAVSALQAFLQVLVTGKTGKGDISTLIPEAQKNSLIPDDAFSSKMFKDIKSILMEERQAKGNAHPKKEYATEQHARLILNLVMVFIQHCISTKSE